MRGTTRQCVRLDNEHSERTCCIACSTSACTLAHSSPHSSNNAVDARIVIGRRGDRDRVASLIEGIGAEGDNERLARESELTTTPTSKEAARASDELASRQQGRP